MNTFTQKRGLSSLGFAASLLALGSSLAQSTDDVDTSTDDVDTTTASPEPEQAPPQDAGLPSAVIQVQKTGGGPASNVAVFAGILMGRAQAPMKTLTAVTDEEGTARFEGLPAGPGVQVSFWFELGGLPVARSHPMELTPGQTLRMDMRLPRMTSDPKDVVIDHVRVVLSRAGALFEVLEVFHLTCRNDCVYYDPRRGYPIPLPKDALAPRPMGEDDAGVRVDDGTVAVVEPIAKPATTASFVFNLPIENDAVTLRQRLPSSVQSAQAISTWVDEKRSSLEGTGFSEAQITETNRGLAAWSIVARNLDGAAVDITLSGVYKGPAELRRNVTLVLSVFLLALGAAAWLRALRRGAEEETKGA